MREFVLIGKGFGTAVSVRRGGPTTDRLRPTHRGEAASRSLSALFGLGEFPFHTDAAHHRVPPRYLILRLADGSAAKTPTLVIDGRPRELTDAEVRTLSRETWLVHGGKDRTFYAPLLDPFRMMLRFDLGCMREPVATRLTGCDLLQERLGRAQVEEICWRGGTTLIADNWRVLHARPAVAEADASRTLLRMLVA